MLQKNLLKQWNTERVWVCTELNMRGIILYVPISKSLIIELQQWYNFSSASYNKIQSKINQKTTLCLTLPSVQSLHDFYGSMYYITNAAYDLSLGWFISSTATIWSFAVPNQRTAVGLCCDCCYADCIQLFPPPPPPPILVWHRFCQFTDIFNVSFYCSHHAWP